MNLQGRNLTQGLSGADVDELHNELTQLGYTIPSSEAQGKQFGAGTLAVVQQLQTSQGLTASGTVDAATAAALTAEVATNTYVVSGVVSSTVAAGLGGLTVQLVDKNVGSNASVASTTTNANGAYSITTVIGTVTLQERRKTSPDLQVRVLVGATAATQTLLAASEVQYNSPTTLTLNVTLPASATGLPSEYETLTAKLTTVYAGSLGSLQENDQQQDITFLANKTGWDARAVAMAALADQFGQITTPAPTPATGPARPPISLQPAFYYALFRAGLPANADQLFEANPSGIQAIWQQAITQGVIPSSLQSSLTTAVQNFQALSAGHILKMAPQIGVSTLQALVAPILTNSIQQTQFASLLSQFHDDWSQLWPAVTAAFGAPLTQQLQFAGQLHFLTLNNAPLVAALNTAELQNPLKAPLDLATRGYYEASKWAPLIAGSVPSSMPGATPADQASSYAEFLAAQVRIAFPTAVLADQVRRGVMPIADTSTVANEVAAFLTANQANFVIGAEPIEAFLTRENITSLSDAATAQIKRLHRTRQLTTDDASMKVLLQHNLDSAYAVTRYNRVGFIRAFSGQLGGEDRAERLHARARQVFSGVMNVVTTYANARIGGALGNIGPTVHGKPTPLPSVPVSATLEKLFGSLDYCDCSDCSSILSPAAYLVDLLHYLDQPSPTPGMNNPQTELFTRRPDLQYLPLTCENTNVALPYIDIVNETLEFFVANSLSLANYQGHDTGSVVSSAELLASPQYVNDAAYTALQGAFFPSPLPFNRPLELLRLQMQNLGVSAPDAMIAFRADDAITNRKTPTSYGWSDILIEQLGISRDEYRLFTDPSLQLGDLYGLPNDSALNTLQTKMNLQQFSRLVGVSYVDLIAILQTQFINPGAALIPKLQALGVSFADIKTLQSASPSQAQLFANSLPPLLDTTQYGGSDGQAVVKWLTNAQNYQAIIGLIVVTNPDNPTGTGDDCSGTSLQFRYANPDPTQNLLSVTDFLKLIRFIRLWGKLQPLLNDSDDSVTIAYVDEILAALYPASNLPVQSGNIANNSSNRTALDTGFGVALLRTGFLFQVMDRLSLTADGSLLQLLACWAPIGTVGPNALYQSKFLTPTLLQQDPGAQTATISTAVNVGDILTTQINNVSLTHLVASGETAASIATGIAAAINGDAKDDDQVSNTALNARFLATTQANQVIIKAGFALSCSDGTFTVASTNPLTKTATVASTPVVGSSLTVTIDTVPIAYVVAQGDTLATIAANTADAINSTTVAHPYSGLPLNTIVAAAGASTGVVSINAANAGAPFTLNCEIKKAHAGTYSVGAPVAAGYTATIGGTVKTGDVLTITINNGVPFTYTALATDTTAAILAASVATTINASVELDSATKQPFSSLVHASSIGSVVTVNPIDPATSFTLIIAKTSGAETVQMSGASASPASQTATVTGPFPAGSILTTTINGYDLLYTVGLADSATSIAANITQLIKSTGAPDPIYNLPLDSFVLAASSGGVITVTAANPTTAFTLSVTASAATYTAGRLSPPFADNGFGAYLQDASQTVFGHEPLLCAACNLSGAEFAQIATWLMFDATTQLTLANVSALFRYGWLAHTLGLSVLEFLRLLEFSGLSPPVVSRLYPFASLDLLATAPAEPTFIRFVRLLQAMNNGNLPAVQALYLIWNQDISGTLAPSQAQVTTLCFALRADFAAVEAQFQLQDDPTGAIAQSLMALVYPAADTIFFFSLLNNTFSVSSPFAYASPMLPQPIIDASGGFLAYDNTSLQLSFSGLLTSATEQVIAAAAAVATADRTDFVAAGAVTLTPDLMAHIVPGTVLVIDSGASQETVVVETVTTTSFTTTTTLGHNGTATPFSIKSDPNLTAQLAALASASQLAVAPFFATYPELQPLYTAYVASSDPISTRRETLLANFLPTLKSIRKAEQALTEITASIGCDPSFASALLQGPTVLHRDADPTEAAVADLTAIEAGGLSAQFYLSNNPNAVADQTIDVAGPMQYVQTATLSGMPTAGAALTTTINGTPIPYAATATDATLAILAGSVAAAINACTTKDGSGLPINRLLTAAVISGATIGISGSQALAANSVFTLACASSVTGLTYTAGSQLPAGHAGGLTAAIWQGFIAAPQNGNYNFSVVTDPGATVTLQIADVQVPMAMVSGVWSNQAQVALTAGTLAPIVLSATSIKSTLAFGWQSPPGLGWGVVPSASLYPQNLVTRLSDTYVRFLKATSLASALPMTAAEIAWLGTDTTRAVNTACAGTTATGPAQFAPQSMANIIIGSTLVIDTGGVQETVTVTAVSANKLNFTAVTTKPHNGSRTPFPIVSAASPLINRGWLNALPGQPDTELIGGSPLPAVETAAKLAHVLSALLNFARIKQALSPNDERLLTLLQAPGATLPNGQSALLSLTGWARVSVNALLTQFFNSLLLGPLAEIENFSRVYDAMQIVQTCRVSASTLISAVTNAPTGANVAALQSALRGLYAEADWLTIVRPINDAIRTQQRDALVAYILQDLSSTPNSTIKTADDLYAWFLIDPLTQPPVETSRIRLALSSIQLFIERIVRNLEPHVSSADVDATQWEWMKRYRIWQANREVFLWPENWLYPQLRDDQSPIFQQMMSALLQGDITDDAAANAYLDYLSGLEEVAKLEPCGLYYVPGSADTDECSYVVARTGGAHRKYYFRQLQGGSWTPWAQVSIECEDMPLTPIVWNNRLFLFWLKAQKQSTLSPNTIPQPKDPQALTKNLTDKTTKIGDLFNAGPATSQAATTVVVSAVLYWTEFYNGKWQPTKSSDVNRPTKIGSFDPSGDNSFEPYRNQIRIVPIQNSDIGVSPSGVAQNIPADILIPNLSADILILAISTPFHPYPRCSGPALPGFLLHNTNSVPVPLEDIASQDGLGSYLGFPIPGRVLGPPDPYVTSPEVYTGGSESNSLAIAYPEALSDWANYMISSTGLTSTDLLKYSWQPRFTEAQPGVNPATLPPFLYEDRRNLFYATTKVNNFTIFTYGGPAVMHWVSIPQTKPPLIPPLQIGLVDDSTNNITIDLSTQSSVKFQGVDIKPTGAAILSKLAS